MYLYKIGFSTMEESSYSELWHEKKITEKDLTEMIAEAVVALIPIFKKNRSSIHSFENFFYGDFEKNDITSWLIKNKGFKKVKYEQEWSAFGWASVFVKSDWITYRDKTNNVITKKVNEAGYDKKDDDFLNNDCGVGEKKEK